MLEHEVITNHDRKICFYFKQKTASVLSQVKIFQFHLEIVFTFALVVEYIFRRRKCFMKYYGSKRGCNLSVMKVLWLLFPNCYYHNVLTYLCSLKISSSFLLAFRVYSYFHPSVGRCKAFSSSFCLEQLLIIFLQCSYGSKRAGTWDFSHNVCVHLYVCDWSSAQSLTFHFNLDKLVNFNRLEDYRSSGKYTKIISGQKLLEQISVLRKVYLFNLGYKYSGCNIRCFFPGILNEKSFHWIFHPIGKFHFYYLPA